MKKLTVLLVLIMANGIWADGWAFTGMGSGEDTVAGSAGILLGEDRKAEAGISFLGADKGEDNYALAAGPYAALRFDVPGLDKWFEGNEVETFAGGGILYDFDTKRPIYIPFVGVLAFPERLISPIAVIRYQAMDGGITGSSTFSEGVQVFLGLRIRTK